MIPEEKIQEILDATDIVELIGTYFPLKRAGTNFRANCPFHNEKTPSFNVNPGIQIFKCFGCGAAGNAIKFVSEHDGLTFPEAVRRLGERAGIHVVDDQPDPAAKERQQTRSKLLQLHKLATEWMHMQLIKSPHAEVARKYLKGRGLNGEIAKRWQIGYAPADGRVTLGWARSAGLADDLLVESGMAARDDRNGQLYSRFRDRVMFPICNEIGDVIAFSGRVLDPAASNAKYMNSPETPLFLKSKAFYGFDKSKRPIMKAEKAIVCEGQLDLITCYEAGIENVIAPLGTAFTKQHASLIVRFAKEVILCNDSDAAGYKSTERSYGELAPEGILVRVVDLPEGLDPDTLIRTKGVEEFQKRVDDAQLFWDYQISHLSSSLNLSEPKDRIQFANILAVTIGRVKEKVVQDQIIFDVSTRLRIPAEDFRGRVAQAAKAQKFRQNRGEGFSSSESEGNNEPPIVVKDRDIPVLCKLALTDEETRKWLTQERGRIAGLRELMEAQVLIKLWESDYDVTNRTSVSTFLSKLSAREEAYYTEQLMKKLPGSNVNDAKESLKRLERNVTRNKIEILMGKLRTAGLADSEKMQITKRVMLLKKELLEKEK